jgi:hypothetical protein
VATATVGSSSNATPVRGLECIEVLAQRGVGEPELGGEIRGRCRFDALQPLDDAALGVGQLCHRTILPRQPYFGSDPCIIDGECGGNARRTA